MQNDDIEVNHVLMREMFNKIRAAEIKNIKTQKRDDKYMANAIATYITKKLAQEDSKEEDTDDEI